MPYASGTPKISEELERIIVRLLEKDRETRYQSATDVRADIKRVERNEKLAAAGVAERVASIAVLPFTDMSAAKDQDWFCDGMAEEILNALTPLRGLRVAAHLGVFVQGQERRSSDHW